MYFFTYSGCPRSLLLRVRALAVPGLCCCLQALSRWGERRCSPCGAVAPGLGAGAPGTQLQRSRFTGSGAASTVGGLCCSVWDLPESGTEPTSPALADRLLTTEPPGKPSTITFFKSKLPTSSLPLFQDKLLQTSAAHTHAFPHSGQHSVGT